MDAALTPLPALVLICRRPRPGSGKQRLANALGPARTHALAELLLATALEDAASWPGPVAISPAEPNDVDWASTLLPRECVVVPQPGGNLGERLNGVDRALRGRNLRSLVYIGSDAPVLDPAYYAAARAALAGHDVVLGPARDGGVTLMGSAAPWPDLADLPWGTAGLHAALALRCRAAGHVVATLAPRYDVDLPADLPALCADLPGDGRPARRRLYHWLRSLGYCGSWHDTTNPC